MAANGWLGKLKSGAKSVQEAAKNRLEKVSETLEKTLKETQEDLDRQRAKPETLNPNLQRWRPSAENPDGEIVAEAKPTPVVQPVIQAPPESPQAPTPVAEPITIVPRKKPRSTKKTSLASVSSASIDSEIDPTNEQKKDSIKRNDSRGEIVLSGNDKTNKIIDQEDVHTHSDELIDKTSTRNELVESTTSSTMSQKEELLLVQNSTSHSEDNIDIKKEEYIPAKLDLNQENIQINIPTEKLTPITDIEVSPTTHSAPENIQIKAPDDELPTLKNTEALPIEHSDPENVPIKISDDELLPSTNTNESTVLNSGPKNISINISDDESTNIEDSPNTQSTPENIQIKVPDDELPTLKNTEALPIEHSNPENVPIKISDNELPTSTNTDEAPIINSGPENISINTPDYEPTASTNIDDSPNTQSTPENIQIKVPDDELPALKNTEALLLEHSDPENVPIKILDDELPPSTDTDEAPIINSSPENISINTPDNEPTASTTIGNSPNNWFAPENIQIKVPDEESPTLTDTEELLADHSDPENVAIKISDNELPPSTNTDKSTTVNSGPENISINIPDDEPTTSTTIDNSPSTQSVSENIQIKVSDNELPTLTDTKELPIEYSDPENTSINIPDDEPTTLTTIENSTNTQSAPENIEIKIPDDELPTLTDTKEVPIEYSDPENVPIKISDGELLPSTNTDESTTVNSGPENISISIPDDESTNIEDTPNTQSTPENIEIKIPDDELPALTDTEEVIIEHSDPENIAIKISDNELPPSTITDESTNANSGPENVSISIPDDEPITSTTIDNSPNTQSVLETIEIKIPNNELSTSTNIDNSPIEDSNFEDTAINAPDGELLTLTSIDNPPYAHSDLENISKTTSDDELPTTTNIADSPIINSKPENIPISISNDENDVDDDDDDDDDDENDNGDELSTLKNIDGLPMVDSGSKSIQMKIPDEKIPALTNVNEIPIAHSDAENISISTSDDELSTLKNIANVPIKNSKSKDELPTLANVVESQIKHSDSNENHSTISENNIKMSSDELEDSFDELKLPTIPVNRPSEQPSQELTHLAALRAFISKIEDDDDDECISAKQDTSILKKNVNTVSEQFTIPNIITNTLSSSSNSISDDPPEDIITETLVQSNSLTGDASYNEINESVSTMSNETKPAETRKLPVVNCHSIPAGTKVYHITCSSTYIYICTIDQKIFYAQLNLNDINYPFKWQQHTDLAERIVVSLSNQTVWRLFKKHLYTANDPIKFPPLGSQWNEIKMDNEQSLLSISITDQCGWYIKEDGTLWLVRTDDATTNEPLNIICPFHLNTVFCLSEKVGVTTNNGEILVRVGCTNDFPAGDGWIFVEYNFGPIDDFILLTDNNIIGLVDKNHHLWVHQWSSDRGFYEILCNDEFSMSYQRYLISVNSELLCFTNCEDQIHIFSDCLIGVQWITIAKNTRLQRLIGAFPNEDYVWALTTDKMISSSNGQILEKPRQAQYITHATFVPNNSSQNTVLWILDESCSIYVRANVENDKQWEQLDQSQFELNRRLINIVCNHAGVWAVDDQGYIHFRHGHISANRNIQLDQPSFLPPAWIPIPGDPNRNRFFAQVYCGPADWMVYATDNKQNIYIRDGINKENPIGTSWKPIGDCSALELAISENTIWLLTSHGKIQCRENISLTNPIGTRSTTLPGRFLSLTVSMDDSQVWALDSQRNLLKLDRLTVLFEK